MADLRVSADVQTQTSHRSHQGTQMDCIDSAGSCGLSDTSEHIQDMGMSSLKVDILKDGEAGTNNDAGRDTHRLCNQFQETVATGEVAGT